MLKYLDIVKFYVMDKTNAIHILAIDKNDSQISKNKNNSTSLGYEYERKCKTYSVDKQYAVTYILGIKLLVIQ